MKRKTITMVLVMGLLLLPITNFAFAYAQPLTHENDILNPTETIQKGETIAIQNIRTYSISFSRKSNTKGAGKLTVLSSTTPSSIKATIRLQVANNGSTSYKNASTDPVTATVYNKASLSKAYSFPITTTKKYRVKATVVETVNGNKNTYTYYKSLS